MMNKKCMKCQKQASYKFVKVENNQIYDMYFCADHAQEMSPYLKSQQQKAMPPLSEILANILKETAAPGPEESQDSPRCNTCGRSFDAYRKTLFLGCSDCYDAFYELLVPELRKFHRGIKHVGRKPGGGKESPISEIVRVPAPPRAQEAPTPAEPVGQMVEAPPPPQPEPKRDPLSEIAELNSELKQAISDEDFELAARLRDTINRLRETLKK